MSNKIYFTPGPTQLFYSFQDHFRTAMKVDMGSLSHRSPLFIKTVEETTDALCELLQIPEGYHLFYISSANEAWDRIIQNLVIKSSHHFANGAFSKKFYEFAIQYKKKSTIEKAPDGGTYQNFNIPHEAELIGLAKNETSVGFTFTEDEIALIRANNLDKLIALDVTSAAPALPIHFNNVDTAYLSVQKAFGMPAGLGLWIVNERCIEKATQNEKSGSIGSYRSLPNLKKFGLKAQTPETPNMIYIYILGMIAKDLLNYGLKRMQNDIIYKATLINQTIENHPLLDHFVTSEKHRSPATIVIKAKHQADFINKLASHDMVVGKGYASYKEEHIRIANFPTHSKEIVENLCDLINKIKF